MASVAIKTARSNALVNLISMHRELVSPRGKLRPFQFLYTDFDANHPLSHTTRVDKVRLLIVRTNCYAQDVPACQTRYPRHTCSTVDYSALGRLTSLRIARFYLLNIGRIVSSIGSSIGTGWISQQDKIRHGFRCMITYFCPRSSLLPFRWHTGVMSTYRPVVSLQSHGSPRLHKRTADAGLMVYAHQENQEKTYHP
jgi:hypothetical protein